jgi:hypothetical protein
MDPSAATVTEAAMLLSLAEGATSAQEAMDPSVATVTVGAMLLSLAEGAMLAQEAMDLSAVTVMEAAMLPQVLILLVLGLKATTVRVEATSRSIFTSTNQLLHRSSRW